MAEDRIIILYNEICPLHGGRNLIYQYADENVERIEICGYCEGYCEPRRPRKTRAIPQGARSERPARPTHPRESK